MLSQEEKLNKVLHRFAFLWLLCGLGISLGFVLPPAIAVVCSIGTLIIVVCTWIFKMNPKTYSKFVYVLAVLMGVTLKYSLTHYLDTLGTALVVQIFGATVIIFIAFGILGYKDKRNKQSWGQYLTYSLLALILVSVISIFFPVSIAHLLISFAGVIIFICYTIYDFNQIKHQEIHEDEVTAVAFNLFLDFINILLYLLKLAEFFTGNKD